MISEILLKTQLIILQSLNQTTNPDSNYFKEKNLKSGLSKDCLEYGLKEIWRIIHHQKDIADKEILQYSGKFLNELGRFSSCSNAPGGNVTYYLIQSGIDFLRFNIGLCVPSACTVEDWRFINDEVNEMIKKSAQKPGNTMAGILPYFSLNMTNVDYFKNRGGGVLLDREYGLFVFMFFGVILLVILFNFISWLIKKNNQFKMEIGEEAGVKNLEEPLLIQDIPKLKDNRVRSRKDFLMKIDLIEIFNIKKNFDNLFKERMENNFEITLDLTRITTYMIIMAMCFVFTHTLTSKVFTDAYSENYFMVGAHATMLQLALMLPDVMLFIGGYIAVKSVLRVFWNLSTKKLMGNWFIRILLSPLIYIFLGVKRYFRYFPLLLLTILYEWKVLPKIASGPMAGTDLNCSKSKFWDTVFLFNNNYAGEDKMCSPWLWYLRVDFILFMTVPLICLLYSKLPKSAIILSGGLSLSCLGYAFYRCQVESIKVMCNYDGMWAVKIMNRPETRGGCYFMGVSLALYHLHFKVYDKKKGEKKEGIRARKSLPLEFETKEDLQEENRRVKTQEVEIEYVKKFEITKTKIVLLIASLFILFLYMKSLTLYFQEKSAWQNTPQIYHTIYNVSSGPIYSITLVIIFWTIISSFDLKFLKGELFKSIQYAFLRKLYFEVFMIHMALILTRNFSWEVLPGLSNMFINYALGCEMVLTLVIGGILHLFITSPIQNLWLKIVELPLIYGLKTVKDKEKIRDGSFSKININNRETNEDNLKQKVSSNVSTTIRNGKTDDYNTILTGATSEDKLTL